MSNDSRTAAGAGQVLGVIAGLVLFATPVLANIDLICPLCEPPGAIPLSVPGLVDLVLKTLLQKGIAVLFVGAIAVVGLPWLIAGVAVAAVQLPRWLRG